ncbi:MAG TPA: poly(R)-hydroxyalkanoic acid synthase subunit PhaE, partial [Bacteroidia bacterium]|nr:poly(R)-hydroxyalkanoic acid synthase subunit PhaE [Bacteroidia bacterium]
NGAAMNDGLSIYKEWLAKQTEITKAASEQATKAFSAQLAENTEAFKNGKTQVNVSEIYNNWLNAQREQMTKAMGNFQNFSNPFTANNPFLANNPFVTNTNNPFADFQNQWWNTVQNSMNQTNQFSQPWTNIFQNWGKGLSNDTVKDAWGNMTNISQAYVKFYELWAPVFKNMQNNSFNADWMKNGFNLDSFKELMDRTISQVSPIQAKELFQQFQSWTEVVNNYNKHVYQQFAANVPENLKTLTPFLLFGNGSADANNAFAIYQRSVSPLIRLFYPGKESELNELMTGMMEKVSVHGQKLVELQQAMYATGAKTWETFLFENAEELKKGKDLSNIQEVFQNWVNKNEASLIELFKTDAFSKIQGELLDLSLDIKQRSEKIAETLLQPLPIMLRSEADELYTTIYELRKRISQLEKQAGVE